MNTPLRGLALSLLAALPFAQVGNERRVQAAPYESAIVFAKRSADGAAVYVLAGGGSPKQLTSPRRVSWRCGCRSGDFDDHPAWSPDGSLIAFTRGPGVYVMKADGSDAHRVASRAGAEDYDLSWSRQGRVTFVRSRPGPGGYVEEIVAARSDGSDVRVLAPASRFGYLNPVWSPDGRRLAYVRGVVRKDGSGATGLFVASVSGGPARLVVSAASITSPAWAPDGSRLAFTAQPTPVDASDLYVIEPRSRRTAQLTRVQSYGAGVFGPSWSPDGDRLLFTYAKKSALFLEDGPSVYTISPDGRSRTRLATNARALAWSPDGRRILLLDHEVEDGRALSLSVMRADGTEKEALVKLDRAVDGLWQAPPGWRG